VKEREQSYDEYLLRCSNRKTATRSTLVQQPLGDVARRHPALLGRLRDYGAAFFGLDTRIAPALALPDAAHVPQRDQHNSSMILDDLAGRLPAGALIYLGIADRDLFARGKKYVFGEGDLERRTGVLSLSRLETPDADLFLRRALRLMSHEAGHILSIAHCVKRRCLMQGSNTLAESDAQPLPLCREDRRKLEWNTGYGGSRRERALSGFYAGLGWAVP
jgi:archaemetzincin